MKLPLTTSALLATMTLACIADNAPIGELSIKSTLTRAGARPNLSWSISFPASSVEEVVTIESDDSVVTKESVRMNVRLLGASFSQDGRTPDPVNFQLQVGSGSWQNVFTGTELEINPAQVLYSQQVPSSTEINFAGSGRLGRYWTPSRNTLTENPNIIALKDGDNIPSYAPAFNQSTISDHVSAYVQDGKIAIGPRDVIYLVELYTSDVNSRFFDLQDLVVIATFDEQNNASTVTSSRQTVTTTTTRTAANGSRIVTTRTARRRRR